MLFSVADHIEYLLKHFEGIAILIILFQNRTVETAPIACVAGGADLEHLHQQRVAVTVQPHLSYVLIMP